jgi:uncharacterized Zn finger protein
MKIARPRRQCVSLLKSLHSWQVWSGEIYIEDMTGMATNIPSISSSQIREWVGVTSFARGEAYFEGNAIDHARLQGTTLKALCQGSQPQPYRVEVTFDAQGITSAGCSCPVGDGGHCKHVAALLLAWMHAPEDFAPQPPLEDRLEGMSKADLITLIRRMLKTDPDLEDLLDLPLPGSSAKPLDESQFQRQVTKAINRGSGGWDEAAGVVGDLEPLRDLAETYADAQDIPNAETAYRVLIETTLDNYDALYDEDGEASSFVNECVQGLGACLEVESDPIRRERILRTLFDCTLWDTKQGGIGVGEDGIDFILEQATPQEKQLVAVWARTALTKAGGDWERNALGGILLNLEADFIDDEMYLKICRESGRIHDLINRLLKMGRADDAELEASSAGDYDLLGLANLFMEHARAEIAERLMRARIPVSKDSRLLEWLKDYLVKANKLEEALSLAEKLFWQRPSTAGYADICQIATSIQQWDEHRERILTQLSEQNQFSLLTGIYISEKAIDQALESYEQYQRFSKQAFTGWWWDSSSLRVKLAEAAEVTHPYDSIHLYLMEAEHFIGQRNRGAYATAAGYLARIKRMYTSLGEAEMWQVEIERIRSEYRRLPALIDEIGKAKLG